MELTDIQQKELNRFIIKLTDHIDEFLHNETFVTDAMEEADDWTTINAIKARAIEYIKDNL